MKQMNVIDKILLVLMLVGFACYGALIGVVSGSASVWKEPLHWNDPYDPARFGEKIVTFEAHEDAAVDGAPVELGSKTLEMENGESEECPYVICYRHDKKFASLKDDAEE